MFTGLIEEIGTVEKIIQKGAAKEFFVKASFTKELKIGESVAINGACQSVTSVQNGSFSFFSMPETLLRTNLNTLKTGSLVNLERSMVLGARLDGHIVQGHVDGTAKFLKKKFDSGAYIFEFEYPTSKLVQKGSIAINGISLTICALNSQSFSVSVIPQTLEKTNLKNLTPAELVNIEIDIFAKYIEKFLSLNDNNSRITEDFLRENGF